MSTSCAVASSGLPPVVCGKAVVGNPRTLVDLLQSLSTDTRATKIGFSWIGDSGQVTRTLTFAELEQEARRVALALRTYDAPGRQVLLVFEPGLDFLVGFFGCVYVGAVPVPVYPPHKEDDFAKLDGLVIDSEARFLLTSSAAYSVIQRKLLNPLARAGHTLKKLEAIVLEKLPRSESSSFSSSSWTAPDVSPDSPAYLQYTSGSTAFPKGVLVTHANAVYNAVAISHLLDTQAPEQLGLCWLPLYHDMGLVGNVLSVLYSRMPMMLMAPTSFLKRPDLFLQLVSRHRVTHVAAPNFAYELCTRKLSDAAARELDLSHLRIALNGAEQVQASTLHRFCDKFGPSGFTMNKFYACYGLAEATLILSGGRLGMPPTFFSAMQLGEPTSALKPSDLLVSCGTTLPEGELRIVDPTTHIQCSPLVVGEIWARGPGVSPGYFAQPDRTREVFRARMEGDDSGTVWLRTGDLGFVNEKGELFVTGRLKDLIILRGKKIYPLDIEWTIHNTSDLIRPGCCAVFSIKLEGYTDEKVVVVAELRRPIQISERENLIVNIRAAIARSFDGLELHDIVLVKDHSIPKTSSGKLMRFACRYNYLHASLSRLDSLSSPSGLSHVVSKLAHVFKPRKEALQRYIVTKVAEAVDLDATKIDPACDVRIYGMDSLRQMQLLRELEDRLGCALPTTLCDEYSSIQQIVELLLSDTYTKISPRLTKFIDEELSAFKPDKRRERRKGSFDELKRESSGTRDGGSNGVQSVGEECVDPNTAHPTSVITPSTQLENYPGEPIAIVGMACRVPKANNAAQFWNNLETGVDAISKIPPDRWNAEAFYDPDMDKPGKMPTMQGGFLDDIDKFDASFFHIGAREAEVMDPQQRMVLEVVYEALEDAGIPMEKLRGTKTGVFTGVCFSDYHKIQVADPDKIRPYVQTGCASSIVPNRISYFYDLKGPSFTVDTACSSSLVALHLACESIRRGECERAIVAGTSTNLLPEMFIAFAKLHMLSPNGRCKAFDASGDGYVRSEGICVLVIEPLSTAARDCDSTRALVRATGTNQDGRTSGLTFPGRDAQEALLREVYARANLTPFDVQFIEAHGTGTRAGDPVEVNAIGSVLGTVRSGNDPLIIGSVKSNIGHLEGASGLAGVIKTVLAIERATIPANLHFQTPNPDIDFQGMHLRVANTSLAWPTCSVRRAGVNSFGFGGSNAHVIIEQAPEFQLPPTAAFSIPSLNSSSGRHQQRLVLPILLSAHTKQALNELQLAYTDRLARDGLQLDDTNDGLTDLAYTLACRRSHHPYRLSAVISSPSELAGELAKAKIVKILEAEREKKVLFVFTGQGAQWYAMGRQLLNDEPVFRACMVECDKIVRQLVGWSLLDVLAQDEITSIINRPDIAQPCTTSLQVSLVRLWRHWGIEPSLVLGHSSGEIASAYAAGALTLEATIRTAVFRGEAMKVNETGKGKMAAIGMTEQEAIELLAPYKGKVSIAAINSPTNCTISGDAKEMDEIGSVLKEKGIFCQFLRIDCAYHSHHMIPVGNRLSELLVGLETEDGETRVPMISTVTGTLCKASDLNADYWVRNLISMVRFWPAVEAAFKSTKFDIVLEIGPHPALQGPLRQCLMALSNQPPAILPSIIRKEDEQRRLMLSLCALHEIGVNVTWENIFRDRLLLGKREPRLLRDLPSFPWQRKSYWHESELSRQSRFREIGHELLGHRLHQSHGAAVWQNELRVSHLSYLKDHVIQGTIVFPGAGYIAMAMAATTDKVKTSTEVDASIEDVVFKKALLFETEQTLIRAQLVLADKEEDSCRNFTISSAEGSSWQEHCTGRRRKLAARSISSTDHAAALQENMALMQAVKERCPHFVSKDECYKIFHDSGLEYGPDFQGIEELHRGVGEAWALIRAMPCALSPSGVSYAIHPTLLDACFQVLIGALSGSLSESYLPISIGKVNVRALCTDSKYFVHATAKKSTQSSFTGSIRLFAMSTGEENVHVENLVCASIGKKGGSHANDLDGREWNESLYELDWKPDFTHLVDHDLLQNVILPSTESWDDEPERVALAYLHRVVNSITSESEKRQRIVPLYRALFDWMENTVRNTSDLESLPELPTQSFSDEEERSIKDESLVVHRIGCNLEEILLGTTDPLSLLFKDDTVYRVYEKGPTFYQANQVLSHALDLFAHKHGQLRVLEIGAGTGGTTSHALPILGKRFVSYTFTDISPSFFEKAKTKFTSWANRMKFQVLDIEKEIEDQGFTPEAFDLIIATDVLHATVDIVKTLTAVRKLVAPGGFLFMNEFVNTPVWIQMVFGTLSGWWRFQDPERRSIGPTLSEEAWRKAFQDSGWAATFSLHDRSPAAIHATFLASATVTSPTLAPATASVYVLADTSHLMDQEREELEAILNQLSKALRNMKRISQVEEVPSHSTVVYLSSLFSSNMFNGPTEAEFAVIKTIVNQSAEVYWIIQGGNMDCPIPQNAPLVGFSRVMRNERPAIKSCVVDVDPCFTSSEVATLIIKALQSAGMRDEYEFVARKGTADSQPLIFVPRVSAKKVNADLERIQEKTYGECAGLRLEAGTAGLLNTLQWRESPRTPPTQGQVEVKVCATGLNFKDVMLAMGMLSDEAVEGGFCGRNLGIECAGIVVTTGEGVSNLAVGQRVVCVAKHCFSTYVTTLAPLVQPIPDWMSFEEAATIPATFLTALYALKNLGKIKSGEKVLIHAAAGGVGQAAIQLAHLFGAEVFATVSSRDKREFLEKELGVLSDHIMNSRNLDFVHEIMEKTRGQGVDLVLNSLSGDALKKSVEVLAPFGRFLEIGKRDIYANSKLDLLPFGHNLSFFAIDLDRLNGSQPETSGKIFRKLMQLFYERKLRPLPHRIYSFGRVEEAFRYMQQGKHIGKIILSVRAEEPVRTLQPRFSFDSKAIYLLIGGLGGFGTAVAKWMVTHGATKLAFISRSGGASSSASQTLQELSSLGASVAVEKADVADHSQLAHALQRIRASFPHCSIVGAMQAAMVLDDCLLEEMTAERFRRVVAPKAQGTRNLIDLLGTEPLQFFILFSSVSAIVGNLAQSNYAAANAFLDAIAHQGRAKGLPLVSINWGAIGDVGYVAERKDLEESMKKRGFYTLPIDHALQVLRWAITDLPIQVVASPVAWRVAANTLPSLSSTLFRSLLVDDGGESGAGPAGGTDTAVSVFHQLSSASVDQRPVILSQSLRIKLSSMLGVAAEDIEMSNKLTDLGVDSLMAVELKNWIDKETRISLSVLDLTGGKSIDELVMKILSLVPLASNTAGEQASTRLVSPSESLPSPNSESSSVVFECYRRVASGQSPKARLICFPYLGGEPSVFRAWTSFLPADVELYAYTPQRIASWEELVPLLTAQLRLLEQSDSVPLVFYGHSMGGLIAYEVASQFRPSSSLVVAAIASPDEPSFFTKEWEGWSDSVLESAPVEDFIRVAMQQGLIVNTTLDSELVRSSILLGKRYLTWRQAKGLHSTEGRKRMQGKIMAIDGEKDLIFTDKSRILSWRDYTTGAFEFLTLTGASHLFLNEDLVMATLAPTLSAVVQEAT